jgi:hypothetical protein
LTFLVSEEGMEPLRCLLCGALFEADEPRRMQARVAAHQAEAAHDSIALQRVRG